MTDRLLLDAARILEREASALRISYRDQSRTRFAWHPDALANKVDADHDEMRDVAKQLRARAKEA